MSQYLQQVIPASQRYPHYEAYQGIIDDLFAVVGGATKSTAKAAEKKIADEAAASAKRTLWKVAGLVGGTLVVGYFLFR